VKDSAAGRNYGYLDVALFLVGIAGLAASLTILWLGMRAVLGVGGFCAEGGPYVIAHHCPGSTAWLIPVAVFAGLGSAGLMGWEGSKLGSPWAALIGLAWPALFISLGWNFLEFAFFPPEGMAGIQIGWLIPGVLFVIMGAVPLIGFMPGGKSWKSDAGDATFAFATPGADDDAVRKQRARLATDLAAYAHEEAASAQHADEGSPAEQTGEGSTDDDLVTKLQRLDALHRSGSLTYDEFHKAKQAVLDEAGKTNG